jgi:hypothetical protein
MRRDEAAVDSIVSLTTPRPYPAAIRSHTVRVRGHNSALGLAVAPILRGFVPLPTAAISRHPCRHAGAMRRVPVTVRLWYLADLVFP